MADFFYYLFHASSALATFFRLLPYFMLLASCYTGAVLLEAAMGMLFCHYKSSLKVLGRVKRRSTHGLMVVDHKKQMAARALERVGLACLGRVPSYIHGASAIRALGIFGHRSFPILE